MVLQEDVGNNMGRQNLLQEYAQRVVEESILWKCLVCRRYMLIGQNLRDPVFWPQVI